MFDFYVVTLNPSVVSCYNPLEKVMVFPGFIRQLLTHKHATVSLRRRTTKAQTSWRSTECSVFSLKFAERIHMRGLTCQRSRKQYFVGLRWRLRNFCKTYFLRDLWNKDLNAHIFNGSARISERIKLLTSLLCPHGIFTESWFEHFVRFKCRFPESEAMQMLYSLKSAGSSETSVTT